MQRVRVAVEVAANHRARYLSGGATDNSSYTSWTATRSVAVTYARSCPGGLGVVLEIEFASGVARSNNYIYQGEARGEDEYLIEGKVVGVDVTPTG